MRRFSSLAGVIGLLVCVATARPAHAQITGAAGTIGLTGAAGTTGSTLTSTDVFIGIQQTEGSNLNDFQLPRFFNKMNCDCSTPIFIYATLTASGFAKRSTVPTGTVSFWIGSQCDNVTYQRATCSLLKSEQISTFMAQGRDTVATTARIMSSSSTLQDVDGGIITGTSITSTFAPTTDCTNPTNGFTQTVWVLFDYGADGVYDAEATQAVLVDLTPPPAPTNVVVRPGDEAVTVTWTPVDYSTNMDLQGYQVLCQRAGGLQVFANNTFASYAETCPATRMGTGLVSLDPAFICSPLLTATASSYRVKILQNGIQYAATVVAIDNSGNPSTPVLVGPNDNGGSFEVPIKTDSFYDVYRNGENANAGPPTPPGAASGGFCAVADAPAGHGRTRLGVGLGAGILVAVALARARRRRRR